jgi:hypothetical protein
MRWNDDSSRNRRRSKQNMSGLRKQSAICKHKQIPVNILDSDQRSARIARKPISAEKQAVRASAARYTPSCCGIADFQSWARRLNQNLVDFHRKTCLPTLDSLSGRQKDRLMQLGVPGLGGDASEAGTIARWRKIMDLLQAGLSD